METIFITKAFNISESTGRVKVDRFATFNSVLLAVHLAGAGITVVLAGLYIKSSPEVMLQNYQQTQQSHNIKIVLHV